MATQKIDMTDLFDKFLTTHKQTHVSVNGQQAQMECSRLWREIKKGKENTATVSNKVSYSLICYNHTNIYSRKFCKFFKHCMKGAMS